MLPLPDAAAAAERVGSARRSAPLACPAACLWTQMAPKSANNPAMNLRYCPD